MMAVISMYSTAICPYCRMAEQLLKSKGINDINRIRVDLEPERRREMMEKTRRRTVPQIYIGSVYVGGFEELAALEHTGKLDALLRQTGVIPKS